MLFKSKRTGDVYASIEQAVGAFKCPGPCDADCPLHDLMELEPGKLVYKCHPRYASAHVAEVAELIGCEVVPHGGTLNQDAYIALIRQGAVRDAQVCTNASRDPMDDDAWYDMPEAEIYLGVFRGPDAMKQAAKYAGTDKDNIRLIRCDSLF